MVEMERKYPRVSFWKVCLAKAHITDLGEEARVNLMSMFVWEKLLKLVTQSNHDKIQVQTSHVSKATIFDNDSIIMR